MFSKAKGKVAIDPRYTPAKNGNDSVIFFRLGCEMKINSQKVIEFFPIKAFGKVADFLHNTIKKDSEISIEAIARTARYVKDGSDVQRTEFHAFSVHDIATNLVVDTRINDANPQSYVAPITASTPTQQPLRSPELQARLDAELVVQKMSYDEVKTIGNKFRAALQQAQKSAAAKREAKQKPPAQQPTVKQTVTARSSAIFVPSTKPTVTDQLIAARAMVSNGSYSDMRG
ncbi:MULTISPECIES: single-stranded DNA-binding protein [unclassified Providencia]|uniref:single-stranded DNA-binding protein n=1 Tax=unclassified Providencia TaxID=2633465 RepID=UPI00234B9918|nr:MULTISPECIES: single-stranded DNA-binding protein [unclassified Providencia]